MPQFDTEPGYLFRSMQNVIRVALLTEIFRLKSGDWRGIIAVICPIYSVKCFQTLY